MEFGLEKCAKLKIISGKREITERNRIKKSGKNQNVWRKGKLHVLTNTGSGNH